MKKTGLTLNQIARFEATGSNRSYVMRVIRGYDTREEFLSDLRTIIVLAFRNLERDSNTFKKEALNEDHISKIVSRELAVYQLNVTRGENVNGETDICIRDCFREYAVTCEAKIYSSSINCYDGFRQLTTRYTTGTLGADDVGGLFLYFVENINIKDKMEKWYGDLPTFQEAEPKAENISSTEWINGDDFNSIHKHYRSGQNFTTWHIPLMLTFAPDDKSAKKSKVHGNKKYD